MIEFASLFLGLVLGPQRVDLVAGGNVASIELVLDGRQVATVTEPPWSALVDFGSLLEPHLLQAVALDGESSELARAELWLNLPRPPAEARVAIEAGEHGSGSVARLTWDSVVSQQPESMTATFDGQPLAISNPELIELPEHDPEQFHFLRVELDFSSTVSSVVEATFGGGFADRVSSELTAVPLVLDSPKVVPSLQQLEGMLLKNGRVLNVLAVDKGPAEVVIVRDLSAQRDILALGRASRRQLSGAMGAKGGTPSVRFMASLKKDQSLRLLSPIAREIDREVYKMQLFPPSPEFTRDQGGIYWILSHSEPALGPADKQRLSDAVAVAGMTASSRNRRRAVILLAGRQASDNSQMLPSQVQHYLGQLHVPLQLWSTHPKRDLSGLHGWVDPIDVSSASKLERAARNLSRLLDRQRIVWIEGIHLPQDISLAPHAERIRLAGLGPTR